MVAPPQLNQQTMRRLASFHVSAFFYLITFNEKIGRGERLPGGIIWIEGTRKTDWGNRKFRRFGDLTKGWRTRILGTAAEGHFRISIKREPQLRAVWSFGLEWNRCLRMIGFFGDHREAAPTIAALPEHEWHVMNARERYREDVPLADEEDSLFGETTTWTV